LLGYGRSGTVVGLPDSASMTTRTVRVQYRSHCATPREAGARWHSGSTVLTFAIHAFTNGWATAQTAVEAHLIG